MLTESGMLRGEEKGVQVAIMYVSLLGVRRSSVRMWAVIKKLKARTPNFWMLGVTSEKGGDIGP